MKRSLRSWLWRIPVRDEVDEELDLHLEMRTRELVDRGMEPAAARERARQRLGDVAHLRRELLDLGRKRDRTLSIRLWFDELRTDIRFAFRQLGRAPAFTAVAALTLALGIGANSAIFALADATLLRPLPFGDPHRLVTIWETTPTISRGIASPLNMQDWLTRGMVLDRVGGFTPNIGGMVMAGRDGYAETVSRQWVTASLFDTLGVVPLRGRFFTHDDDVKSERVVVLSETFWRTRLHADESVVGRQIRFDGDLFTVTGIAPASFQLAPGKSEMWAMRPFANLPERARGFYAMQAVGRLKPGIAIETAQTELSALAGALQTEPAYRGTASSLFGALQMAFGAAITAVVAAFYRPTIFSVAIPVAGAGLMMLLIVYGVRAPRQKAGGA